MEGKGNEYTNQEEFNKRVKTFESLKKFFATDMRIKEKLLNLAPTEIDDFNEESRMEYIDKVYKELNALEAEFNNIAENFELDSDIKDLIKQYFTNVKQSFLISKYDKGVIQNLYRTRFSNMNQELTEDVKKNCVGVLLDRNLNELINKSNSINELLHVMHSYITNDEKILESMPILDIKENNIEEEITLYGEETEISRKLFEKFPLELDCGKTEIISIKNKILMMIRDRGHALTIDIDISNENDIFVKYFVPKLCSRAKIEQLPGVNKEFISESGANGMFKTSKEEFTNIIFEFIDKVPTDADMRNDRKDSSMEEAEFNLFQQEKVSDIDIEQEEKKVTEEVIFEEKDVKEMAMDTSEKGRKIGSLKYLQKILHNVKVRIMKKYTKETGENINDGRSKD